MNSITDFNFSEGLGQKENRDYMFSSSRYTKHFSCDVRRGKNATQVVVCEGKAKFRRFAHQKVAKIEIERITTKSEELGI